MCLWPILWLLYAAPLTRATAVVGLWSDVLDAEHLQAGGLERANRGLTPRAGALDEHLDLLETVLDALAGGRVGRDLGGERSRLARALEPSAAGGLPRDHVAPRVCQGDDRVVERSLDVRLADRDVLANATAAALRASRSGHLLLGRLLLAGDLHSLRALACARVGLGVLAVHGEPAAVAQPSVGADLLKPLDVLRALAAQVALDGHVVVDQLTQLDDLVLGQVANLAVWLDVSLLEQLVRLRAADPVDVGET